jgi:hypothetical protein
MGHILTLDVNNRKSVCDIVSKVNKQDKDLDVSATNGETDD